MLALDKICEVAQENILRDGYLVPMLAVETKTEIQYVAISEMPDEHLHKRFNFWMMGKTLAANLTKPLVSLTFVTEAWMVKRSPEDAALNGRISEQPDRIEIIIIAQYQVQADKTIGRIYDIVRSGVSVDLMKQPHDDGIVYESVLLDEFVKGWHSENFA